MGSLNYASTTCICYAKHVLYKRAPKLIGLSTCMDRTVVTAAGTGSASGLILNLLAQALASNSPPPFECPICLDLPEGDFHWKSLVVGLLLGLAIGPVVDLLYGIKLLWRRATARWWGLIIRSPPFPLYRVHE